MHRARGRRLGKTNQFTRIATVSRFCQLKKLLIILFLIVVAGLSGSGDAGASTTSLSAFTGACGPLPPPSWPSFKDQFDTFVMALCYQEQQWPHEASRRSSEGPHAPFVKLWYSPQLYRWMTTGNRHGPIPDGSVVIKEEYGDDVPTSPIIFWSRMIKDSGLWWDGWYWAVVGTEVTSSATTASTTTSSTTSSGGCAEPQFSYNGPTINSINCIGCDASAILVKLRQPWSWNVLRPAICDPGDRGERERHASVLLSADPNAGPSRSVIGIDRPAARVGTYRREATVRLDYRDTQDLDDPSTYTGKFNVGPANEVYGPYPSGNTEVPTGDNVIRVPMVNSVGIVPVSGLRSQRQNSAPLATRSCSPSMTPKAGRLAPILSRPLTSSGSTAPSLTQTANPARTAICPTISRAGSWRTKSPTSRTARSRWYQRSAHLQVCRSSN
jgi:hypothetical protein